MSASNSYETTTDMDMAVTELYYLVRQEFYTNYDHCLDFLGVSDLVANGSDGHVVSNLSNTINPTSSMASYHWTQLYKLIGQCNVCISRVGKSSLSDENKAKYEAKGRFFRAYAYRTLAYLYGGVPLQLEEVTKPKTNYTRASKEEVLKVAIEDAVFAAEHLDDIQNVKDGEVSNAAANFLLGELYLANGDNEKAVATLSKLIENPNLSLMTERFGSRAGEDGDVYWDLFRRGNQNRNEGGNKESIWVIQLKEDVKGGGSSTSSYFWSADGGYWLERYCAPQVGQFTIDYNGRSIKPFLWPIGDYTGGRGIGTFIPIEHFNYAWGDYGSADYANDIRNSEYNFPRKFKYTNKAAFGDDAELFGDYFDVENPNLPEGAVISQAGLPGSNLFSQTDVPNRYIMGYQTKCVNPYNYPDAAYADKNSYMLTGTGGKVYTDQYMMRLAEVYLLRAEAYLKKGDAAKAADDINVVRRRSNASDVESSKVDMDYILDERMREFGIEEKRFLTLARLGLVYDRIKKYNPFYWAENSDDAGILEKYNMLPIPQSVKEANKDAELGQNPGY